MTFTEGTTEAYRSAIPATNPRRSGASLLMSSGYQASVPPLVTFASTPKEQSLPAVKKYRSKARASSGT
ncbi:hypothetical protein [Streptomyces meridianus]|uniref:Uncharacterized protein n=1 Tax=Streptomyces meridianus TaxID=2938945 RepID=A0ABT0WZV0_9ACTN|nr:hypothetical protein [Streptomyces meridianus]MCM2575848.1 hypothetical protein [Streptomyces meridianus]